jgi:hypothetical protein
MAITFPSHFSNRKTSNKKKAGQFDRLFFLYLREHILVQSNSGYVLFFLQMKVFNLLKVSLSEHSVVYPHQECLRTAGIEPARLLSKKSEVLSLL